MDWRQSLVVLVVLLVGLADPFDQLLEQVVTTTGLNRHHFHTL